MTFETESKNNFSPPSLGGVARSAGVSLDEAAVRVSGNAELQTHGLPIGWTTATISELINEVGVFCDGDWVETEDQDPNGDVRLIQLADIGDGCNLNKSNRFLTTKKAAELRCTYLAAGDVLIARMPDPLGRACIFPGDDKAAVTAVDVCIVRTGTSKVDHRWLKTFINAPHFRAKVAALQSGSTRKRISRKNLATIHLPVPPTNEQIRIAEKVEELFSDLDAGVAALKRARANLKRYRAAVLKAAVEGKLTEQWRSEHPDVEPASKLLERILAERRRKWEETQLAKYAAAGKTPPNGWKNKYAEPAKPDSTALPALPEGWCWASVEQCASFEANAITDGPFGSNLKTSHYTDSGPRVIRLQNIGDGNFVDEQTHISQTHFLSLQKHAVNAGDLVIALLGEELPRACIVPEWVPPAIVKADCARFKPNNELTQTEYLNAALNARPTRELATLRVKGVGRPRLNLSSIREIALPLPPIEEQREIAVLIAERISTQEQTGRELSKAVGRASNLRQAILKRAFEGKLVPQDPDDEPASVLLERIRAARAASAPPARNGRGKRIRAA